MPNLNPLSLKTGEVGSLLDIWGHTPYPADFVPDTVEYAVAQILDEKTAVIDVRFGVLRRTRFLLISPIVDDLQEGQTRTGLPGTFIVEKKRKYTPASGGEGMIPVIRSFTTWPPHLAKLKRGNSP